MRTGCSSNLKISCKIACPCFDTITSSTPAYLSHLQQLYSSWSLCSNSDTCFLKLLLYYCKTKGDCTFSHFGIFYFIFLSSLPHQKCHSHWYFQVCSENLSSTFKNLTKPFLFDLLHVCVCVRVKCVYACMCVFSYMHAYVCTCVCCNLYILQCADRETISLTFVYCYFVPYPSLILFCVFFLLSTEGFSRLRLKKITIIIIFLIFIILTVV